MIALKPELVTALDTPAGLQDALQTAIELEHSTIPPYLYATFSLDPSNATNSRILSLISSVVAEEMAHLALAANVLNAIGGSPAIDNPKFVPAYPTGLPGSVEDQLCVELAPFSKDVVEKTFMVIEEPENPLVFEAIEGTPPLTIGMFYDAIKQAIVAAGEGIFKDADPTRQVSGGYTMSEVMAVGSVATASLAIDTIVEQGEGTTLAPLDLEGDYAHYYRFAEILHGHELEPVPNPPPGTPPDKLYTYTGKEIPCDPKGIYNLVTNPQRTTYRDHPLALRACDTFNYTYTTVLKSLHTTFNGQPDQLPMAIGLMQSLLEQAQDMAQIELGDGTNAGPSFEYQPVNPAVAGA